MKVVKVTAYRDYEGAVWTELFSTYELAKKSLREADYEDMISVDSVDVGEVELDTQVYTRLDRFEVTHNRDAETYVYERWDSVMKKMREAFV